LNQREHWRNAAVEAFPEQNHVITASDEEYACYSFFFWLREQFEDAILDRNASRGSKLLRFLVGALRQEFRSDGEDIGVAAGVSFAEHLCDDHSEDDWSFILSLLSHDDYLLCRPYLENWFEPHDFISADEIANDHYA
jgi:hypothetical protein